MLYLTSKGIFLKNSKGDTKRCYYEKNSAVLLALLMVAVTFASCAGPSIGDIITDDSYGDESSTGISKPEETPSIDDSGNSDATTDQKPDSGDNKDPNPTPNPDTGDNKDPAPTPDFFAPPTAASIYSGTPDISWYTGNQSEYVLTTADQLAGLNKLRQDNKGAITFEGVTIKLGADIIINEGSLEQIKAKAGANKQWVSVDSDYVFKGTFDGQGHSISGVYISTAYSYVSMFGGVAGNAQIKNFVLENSYFVKSQKPYFGAIIGRINDASANVSLTDIILADTVLLEEGANGINYVGGFVGLLEKGKLTLSNCHFNGKVNFPNGEHIAGFVGKASGGTNIVFNNCHGSGQVIAKDFVAGLSVYTDSTTKKNNGSCLTGSIFCISGSNKNASYIK